MAGEDLPYVAWIRAQDCSACGAPGPCEPHHSTNGQAAASPKGLGGRRGKGQRAHDHEAIPLHIKCHRQFHDARGFCEGWDRAKRRAWQDEQVRLLRERYELADEAPGVARGTKPVTRAKAITIYAAEFRERYPEIGPQGEHELLRVLSKVAREARTS